jgi:hypothetical protein
MPEEHRETREAEIGFGQLDDELVAVLSIEDESQRVYALGELAPTLPDPLLERALETTVNLQDINRATALGLLAPHLPVNLLHRAFELAQSIQMVSARNDALGRLAHVLPEDLRHEAINIVQKDSDNYLRLKAWVGLFPYLSSELKQEAISTALQLTDEREKATALLAFAPHLPDAWKAKALASIRAIGHFHTRALTLARFVQYLPKDMRGQNLSEALRLSRELSDPWERVDALKNLYPLLPRELRNDVLEEMLSAARTSGSGWQRSRLLVDVASLLPEADRPRLFKETLENVSKIEDENERGEEIAYLASILPASLQAELLSVASTIEDGNVRSRALLRVRSILEEESEPTAVKEGEVQSAVESPPVDQVSGKKDVVEQKVVPEEEAAREKEAEEHISVATYLHSDKWTLDDRLNYSLYANAIAEFIRHEDTQPPLTIGILAPWGQGKTTLMKLIQYHLELKSKHAKSEDEIDNLQKENFLKNASPEPPASPAATFGHLRKWLAILGKPAPKKLDYPTIWFNAWKYQSSEQVWAGMAYCILSQLVEQIEDPIEREKFWLALQAERIDFNAVRQDIYRIVFERFLPKAAICALIGVTGIFLSLVGAMASSLPVSGAGFIAVLVGLATTLKKWAEAREEVDSRPLEGKFTQYVRQPSYEGKLGFLHEVDEDVRRVFDLLVDPKKPAVIFVDDLDRCSPGKVAEVIEAINLFLSGDFPNCYFVIGMDAQVVAASMEVAYEDLATKLKNVTRSYGSLGWYFMDKFVQLQFVIPNVTADQRTTYLAGLFGQLPELSATKRSAGSETLDEIENRVKVKLESKDAHPSELLEQAASVAVLRDQRPQVWRRLSHSLIEAGAKRFSDDSPVVQKYLNRYATYLGASPRTMKRFANLYRFYSLTQLSRQSQGLPAASPAALARWLVLMLRWPQVVRWIQWEGEAKLAAGTTPSEKAALEDEIYKAG